MTRVLTCPHLETGPDGRSRFQDLAAEFELVPFLAGLPPLEMTSPLPASACYFVHRAAGWHTGWHPSPRKLINVVLAGEVEIETGCGERRRFGRGSLFVSGDLSGAGHQTRVVSPDDWISLTVLLA